MLLLFSSACMQKGAFSLRIEQPLYSRGEDIIEAKKGAGGMWIFRRYRVPNSCHRSRPHCHRPTPFRQAVYMIETVTCVAKPLLHLNRSYDLVLGLIDNNN